jgi:hypothetical protein
MVTPIVTGQDFSDSFLGIYNGTNRISAAGRYQGFVAESIEQDGGQAPEAQLSSVIRENDTWSSIPPQLFVSTVKVGRRKLHKQAPNPGFACCHAKLTAGYEVGRRFFTTSILGSYGEKPRRVRTGSEPWGTKTYLNSRGFSCRRKR